MIFGAVSLFFRCEIIFIFLVSKGPELDEKLPLPTPSDATGIHPVPFLALYPLFVYLCISSTTRFISALYSSCSPLLLFIHPVPLLQYLLPCIQVILTFNMLYASTPCSLSFSVTSTR
uniref:Uncharacterized protein n=1 Tax=Anguilla anguilla TaxID=7936 RepID=A0A0E9RE04_ANGAN